MRHLKLYSFCIQENAYFTRYLIIAELLGHTVYRAGGVRSVQKTKGIHVTEGVSAIIDDSEQKQRKVPSYTNINHKKSEESLMAVSD